MMTIGWTRAALVLATIIGGVGAAHADRIKNPTAVFSGLDKITGRIVSFEVGVGETVQFGSLRMTASVCFTKPSTESPNTTSFVEVDDTGTDGKTHQIFSGWMFASSPGLHGIEHPVYDIWLVDCKGGTEVISEPKEVAEEPPVEPATARPVNASQPGDIMAPPAAPAQAAPAPPPVETAPLPRQQPVRRAPQTPILGNNRSNDR